MKILILGRSLRKNKLLKALLRKKGVPDADMDIILPHDFEHVVTEDPDVHFMCVYISDRKWNKEDEFFLFWEKMNFHDIPADNCFYHEISLPLDQADEVYAIYHMWQNLTKVVKTLIKNDSVTMECDRVVIWVSGENGFPVKKLVSIDNFIAMVTSDPEGMAALARAYFQIADVTI